MHASEPGAESPQEGPATLKAESRGRWFLHLVLVGCYPVVLGLLGWNRPPSSDPALSSTSSGLLFTCGIQLAIFGLVFFLGWAASRISREDLLLRWRGGVWPLPLGIAYSVGLRLVLGFVAVVIFAFLLLGRVVTAQQLQEFTNVNRPDVSAMVDLHAMRANPAYFWLTVTFVSFVVAGLREELWRVAVLAAFRHLWPARFSSRGGQLLAVAIIALAFGVGHLSMGPIAVVAAVLLGVGLGFVMVLHRSIWPAVIAHGMFDATTFALLPWVAERLPR